MEYTKGDAFVLVGRLNYLSQAYLDSLRSGSSALAAAELLDAVSMVKDLLEAQVYPKQEKTDGE